MDGMAGRKPGVVIALNLSVVLLVVLWLFPTLGLFVSSFRTGDQITASGWWSARAWKFGINSNRYSKYFKIWFSQCRLIVRGAMYPATAVAGGQHCHNQYVSPGKKFRFAALPHCPPVHR